LKASKSAPTADAPLSAVPSISTAKAAQVAAPGPPYPESPISPHDYTALDDKYAEERERYEGRIEQALKLADELHSMEEIVHDEGHTQALEAAQEDNHAHAGRKATIQCSTFTELREFTEALYSECDLDHSQALDKVELEPLAQLLFDKRPDVAQMYAFSIERAVADIMVFVDDDHSGGLDYVEFVHLLAMPPWSSLIPAGLQEEVHELSEKLLQERVTEVSAEAS